MNNIDIVKINKSETAQLQLIGKQCFIETFGETNSEENMQKYLNESFSFGKLTSELANPFSEFYFAKFDNRAIGYLKLNFQQAQTELQDSNAIEIERIYILKEFQNKRVGQALYNKALEVAKYKNVQYIWLGVWEKNLKAITFYKKNGFVEFDKHIFILGNDEQTDLMMKLTLH